MSRSIILAVLIGAVLGIALGGLALLAVTDVVSPTLHRIAILRDDLIERLTYSTETALAPTPLAEIPLAEIAATLTQPSTTPTPTGRQPQGHTPGDLQPGIAPAIAPTRAWTRTPIPAVEITPTQPALTLRGVKHDWQRWNNCAPTTLGMNLSYYGRKDTQAEIAAATKPNPDDRNVRPDELAAYAQRASFATILRVNGTLDRLKSLVSNGIPVIVETGLTKEGTGWMGHYRLVIGYDAMQFIMMDSYNGANFRMTYPELDSDWRAFNRLYLVIYRPAQEARVRAILADTLDDRRMYEDAAARARAEGEANPKDAFAPFNLGTNLVALKRYSEAAAAFDRARALGLPFRMLWYQFGPYEAYLQTGRNGEVVTLADSVLRHAQMLEEAHYYKGLALRALGKSAEARREFETAVTWNKNYADAQRALAELAAP